MRSSVFLVAAVIASTASAFAPTTAPVGLVQLRSAPETIVMMAARKKAAGVKKSSSSFGGSGKGGKRAPGASQTVAGVVESAGEVGDFLTGEGLTAAKILIPLWALFVGHSIGLF
mmetsp:Transcript_9580/g.19377  ORF Transcript_9580/g.19377 Transcript_9580/m.19377 type:complete len:115 (-) Transcript_9580:168-512(-)